MSTNTPRQPPFFVLGAQRSGTTMLRLMLNAHPRLAVPHETAFMTSFLQRLDDYGDLSVRANAAHLLDAIAQEKLVVRGGHIVDREAILAHRIDGFPGLIDAIMSEYARAQGKARWGDKTPYYTPDIDLIWKLFPGCQIIHLVRDGRAVVNSQRDISWMSSSVHRLAGDWRWKTTICHKVGSVLGPAHYFERRYEELVTDTERVLSEMCAFLGEEFAPEMLRYHERAGEVVPAESLQWHRTSVQAPDPEKIHAWKTALPLADRIVFDQVAGETLELFGYRREELSIRTTSKLRNLLYYGMRR